MACFSSVVCGDLARCQLRLIQMFKLSYATTSSIVKGKIMTYLLIILQTEFDQQPKAGLRIVEERVHPSEGRACRVRLS